MAKLEVNEEYDGPELPETKSELILGIWGQVQHGLMKYQAALAEVDSHKPPTEEALWEAIENSKVKDVEAKRTQLTELKDQLFNLQNSIDELGADLTEWASKKLTKPVTAEQKAQARQTFNTIKTNVQHSLHSLRIQAEYEEQSEVVDFAEELLDNMSETLTSAASKSSKTMEQRAWLQENGFPVKDKGRIPEEYLQKLPPNLRD